MVKKFDLINNIDGKQKTLKFVIHKWFMVC